MADEESFTDLDELDNIKDIRAEGDYFKRMCFFNQLAIMRLVHQKVTIGRGLEETELYAIEAAIRLFESQIAPLCDFDVDYLAKREEIIDELNTIPNKAKAKEYFVNLMKWNSLISHVISKETDYLPQKKVGLEMWSNRVVFEGENYWKKFESIAKTNLDKNPQKE